MADPLTIILWWWRQPRYRKEYTPERVNAAARMIQRNVTIPHKILCITDQPENPYLEVETYPLWDEFSDIQTRRWKNLRLRPQSYRRLKCFDPKMRDVLGDRFVSIDLDCVVLGSLDEILSRPEEFVLCESIWPSSKYIGCMWMAQTGARPELYKEFDQINATASSREWGGSDQAWFSYRLNGEATWAEEDGVYFYTPNMQNNPLNRPKDAKIIFFNSKWCPWDPELQELHPWIEENYG